MISFDCLSVVLVHPQIAENTGMVARSMLAFGFQHLRLVRPEFARNQDSPAYKTCCGADAILDNAAIFDSVEKAIADVQQAIGFSRRDHSFSRIKQILPEWIEKETDSLYGQKTALLFGPEDFGLSNEDKMLCSRLVEIPMRHETLSLNLSHSVTLVLYQIASSIVDLEPQPPKIQNAITQKETQLLIDRFEPALDRFHASNPGKKLRHREMLRSILLRCEMTQEEYAVWMGLLDAMNNEPHS